MARVINPLQSVRAFTKALNQAIDKNDSEALEEALREAGDLATHFKTSKVPMVIPRNDQRALWAAIKRLIDWWL